MLKGGFTLKMKVQGIALLIGIMSRLFLYLGKEGGQFPASFLLFRVLGQIVVFHRILEVIVEFDAMFASQPFGVAIALGSHGTPEGIRLGFRPEAFWAYASDGVGGLLASAKRSLNGGQQAIPHDVLGSG